MGSLTGFNLPGDTKVENYYRVQFYSLYLSDGAKEYSVKWWNATYCDQFDYYASGYINGIDISGEMPAG